MAMVLYKTSSLDFPFSFSENGKKNMLAKNTPYNVAVNAALILAQYV